MQIIRRALCAVVILLAMAAFRPVAPAAAHPLDEYLQATYLRLGSERVAVELDLTAGPLVASEVIALLDGDGDGQISAAEGRAYGERVSGELALTIDGQPVTLTLDAVSVPDILLIEAGAGMIRLDLSATFPAVAGEHELVYRNAHQPVKSAYEANTLKPQEGALSIGQIGHDETQQGLTVSYAVTAGTASASATATTTAAFGVAPLVAVLAGTGDKPWWLLVALAALLGGLHALTPGHGKTLAAAYLVGSRGTPRHAVLLGGTTTITHTASVFVLGLVALLVGHSVAAGALTTALELGAGLLVLVLGLRLLWNRGRTALRGAADSGHDHSHEHGYEHGHSHGPGQTHHHHLPPERLGPGGLIALGVSGGLTPCPEALGVMLVAISLGRVWQGLGLITAFSLGLAATITALGMALVLLGSRVRQLGVLDRPWVRLLPLGSAALITVLGGVMTARVVFAALGVLG